MEVEYLEDVKEQLDFQRYFNVLLPQDEDSLRMRQKSSVLQYNLQGTNVEQQLVVIEGDIDLNQYWNDKKILPNLANNALVT
ncbi:1655_t:CDS:2, partial [Funneliformis geosporum]